MKNKKKSETKNYVVTYEIKIRGTMVEEGTSEEEVKRRVMDRGEFADVHIPQTCEMTDWDVIGVREEQA